MQVAQVEGNTTITKTTASGAVTGFIPLAQSSASDSSIFLETKFFDLVPFFGPNTDTDSMVRLRGFALELQEADPQYLQLFYAGKENENDPAVWNGPFEFVPGKVLHLNQTLRMLAIRLTETIPTIQWQFTAITIFGTPVGRIRR